MIIKLPMKTSILILFTLCLLSSFQLGFSQEICDNALDDDGDGLVDLNDPDCQCFSAINNIPNPSFEAHTACPSLLSQMNRVNNWIQASSSTSDYFNTCGFFTWLCSFISYFTFASSRWRWILLGFML